MTTYKAYTKKNAELKAKRMRKKGYNCSVYPLKKGMWGVSVTR